MVDRFERDPGDEFTGLGSGLDIGVERYHKRLVGLKGC